MDGGAPLLCALLLLVYTGMDALAITVQSNSSTDVLVGNNIDLSITYNSAKSPLVYWSKDNVPIAQWLNGITTLSDQYQGRVNITGNGSLIIYNSTKDDSGNYTVTVAAFTEAIASLTFPVIIYDPVKSVSVSQSPAAVDESTPAVNLTCSALSGAVTYTWSRDGQSLPSNSSYVILDGGPTLQIKLPDRTYSGNYTCNVSNPFNWDTSTWMLSVSYSDGSRSLSMAAGVVIGAVCGVMLLTEELWR